MNEEYKPLKLTIALGYYLNNKNKLVITEYLVIDNSLYCSLEHFRTKIEQKALKDYGGYVSE